jgi:hypothetical protein
MSVYLCLSLFLSLCVKQLEFHWTHFREILYWVFLLKPKDSIQICLKSDNETENKEDNNSVIIFTTFRVK